MTKDDRDIWSRWLLERRFGGDRAAMQAALTKYLYPWRDTVLSHANLQEGEILLDVGCGDGLIAFGALEKVKTSRVIFSDISQDLLDHAQSLAQAMNVLDRCQFVNASADDLSVIEDASVDVVTTRSVLIYVSAKQLAFQEFYRALKPGGRLSIFEPISRFSDPEPPHIFAGYNVRPVIEIAQKLKAHYEHIQPRDTDPMCDFDERDLVAFAEQAGFNEVHLELRIEIKPIPEKMTWEQFLHYAANPKVPTIEEAMQDALTSEEVNALSLVLRPLVEQGQGIRRGALAFLWATK
jgi:ubiquinone/menaquinone biosynthesis C-methylase UbiE